MIIKNYSELINKVKNGPKKTVVVVQADDAHALEAVIHAADIVDAVLVGNTDRIAGVLRSLGQNPGDFHIVQVPEGEHPSVTAAGLVHTGTGDIIMKGNMTTGDLLKGVLAKESSLRKSELMSHLAIIENSNYHKLIFLTDSGMCLHPDFEQKEKILLNAVNFIQSLGYEHCNAAALCSVETVNPKMPETVDAGELKRKSLANELQGCYVEGPISYDLAVNPESARIKSFACPCSGDFDILLAPNMLVGNILGKCLVYSAGSKMAGLVLGAKVPIVVTSRGSTAEEKYNSIAIAASV
jgi:Phosphotransacetylase